MTCQPLVLLIAAGLVLPATAAEAADARLDGLKWKARPIVVLSDSRYDSRVARQRAALDGAKRAVDARDIKILLEAEPHGVLRRQLGLEEAGFAVVLVGKDGSVKAVWRQPVDPKKIFTIIDAMPMRRDEMKA